MSKTGVIAALVIAVALAVAAVVILRPSPPPAAPTRLLPFAPSQIVGLSVLTVAGSAESIERRIEGGWTYLADDGGRWSIDRTMVDNALRLLGGLTAVHDAGGDGGEGGDGGDGGDGGWENWPSFSVTIEGGDVWQVWCSPNAIGGSRSVRVQPSDGRVFTARVEGEIISALVETGLGAWRVHRALPDVSADTTRIRLESSEPALQLIRKLGRWRLVSPVAVAADNGAAEMLLRYLAAVEVYQFVTGNVDRTLRGLDEPAYTVTIEREIMTGPPGSQIRQVERRQINVGGAADVTATRLNAEILSLRIGLDGSIAEEASTIVELDAKSLLRITAAPIPYVSKRAAEVSSSNVGAVTIRTTSGEVRFDKTIDGWFRRSTNGAANEASGGEGGEADPQSDPTRVLLADEAKLTFLLTQLCDTDATSVGIVERVDLQELCMIDLGSLGGQPLETLTISTTLTEEIVASQGDVYWVLPGNLDEALTWLLHEATGEPGVN